MATKDIITGPELQASRAKSAPVVKGVGLAKAADEDKPGEPVDDAAALMARTSFISDAQNSVMVPSGAVLHVGELRNEVSAMTSDKPLVSWNEFVGRNGSWLKELQLTAEQVNGKGKLDPRVLKSLGSGNFIVVSTYCHQPVAAVPGVKDAFKEANTTKK